MEKPSECVFRISGDEMTFRPLGIPFWDKGKSPSVAYGGFFPRFECG